MLTPSMLTFLTCEMGVIGEPAACGGQWEYAGAKRCRPLAVLQNSLLALLSPNTAGGQNGEWEGAVCAPGSGYGERFLGQGMRGKKGSLWRFQASVAGMW